MSEADSLQAGRNRAGECCPAVAGISVEQPHLPELFFDVSGFDVHDRSCEIFPQHQTMGPGVSPQLRKQCLGELPHPLSISEGWGRQYEVTSGFAMT